MTCLPLTRVQSLTLQLNHVAKHLFRNWSFSALLFDTQRLKLEVENFCLAVQGALQKQSTQYFFSNTCQCRSREYIPSDFPAFVYKIHALQGE